jgi:hypothetical protein
VIVEHALTADLKVAFAPPSRSNPPTSSYYYSTDHLGLGRGRCMMMRVKSSPISTPTATATRKPRLKASPSRSGSFALALPIHALVVLGRSERWP